MTQNAYRAQIAMAMLALAFVCSLAFVAGCNNGDDGGDDGGGGGQIDRMAFPAINTALVPSAKKDMFNASSPRNDDAQFLADFTNTINALRTNVSTRGVTQNAPPLVTAAGLADALCPDVVNVDLGAAQTGNVLVVAGTAPTQTITTLTLNGRNLSDDVIDAALILILNNGAATDSVGPKTYLGTFPYLNTP